MANLRGSFRDVYKITALTLEPGISFVNNSVFKKERG